MEIIQKELIETYEKYVSLLGEEIRDLSSLVHGWRSRRLKEGAEYRKKIIELKQIIKTNCKI